jgi:hypothetical protein
MGGVKKGTDGLFQGTECLQKDTEKIGFPELSHF